MSRTAILFQSIDSTGEVIGNGLGDCEVAFHGWTFSNSGAATYEVDFYVGTPPTTGSGNAPVKPSASTTKPLSGLDAIESSLCGRTMPVSVWLAISRAWLRSTRRTA